MHSIAIIVPVSCFEYIVMASHFMLSLVEMHCERAIEKCSAEFAHKTLKTSFINATCSQIKHFNVVK